jgi:hypothetical protein
MSLMCLPLQAYRKQALRPILFLLKRVRATIFRVEKQ